MSYEDNLIISVNNAGKSYKIFNTPRDRLQHALFRKKNYREFWALNPLSIQIKRGESWGVIGRNGSGKSTFLQLLTGTLSPSTGDIYIKGSISALLELGAGFNPEFSGFENIYLYTSLLGFSKRMTDESLDQILAFADIGDHISQPVKTYSSGMFLRLAFACAINVHPDILIVDEALAVGDAKFQLKCHKKIRNMLDTGTSLLFVSHSTESVKDLCGKSLVLDKGAHIFTGNTRDAVVKYYQVLFPEESGDRSSSSGSRQYNSHDNNDNRRVIVKNNSTLNSLQSELSPNDSISAAYGIGGASIGSIKLSGNKSLGILEPGDKICISISLKWSISFIKKVLLEKNLFSNITTGIAFCDIKGNPIFGVNGFDAKFHLDPLSTSSVITSLEFTFPHIRPGDYFMTAAVALGSKSNHIQLQCYDAFSQFNVPASTLTVNGLLGVEFKYVVASTPDE